MNKSKYIIIRVGTKLFFSRHITYDMNHWVRDVKECRKFNTFKEALNCIKKYDLKHCMILKEG